MIFNFDYASELFPMTAAKSSRFSFGLFSNYSPKTRYYIFKLSESFFSYFCFNSKLL